MTDRTRQQPPRCAAIGLIAHSPAESFRPSPPATDRFVLRASGSPRRKRFFFAPFPLSPDFLPLFGFRVASSEVQTGRTHRGARPTPARPCRFTRSAVHSRPGRATVTTSPRCPRNRSRQETSPVMPIATRGQTARSGPLRFFPFVCGGLSLFLLAKEQTTFNRKEKPT